MFAGQLFLSSMQGLKPHGACQQSTVPRAPLQDKHQPSQVAYAYPGSYRGGREGSLQRKLPIRVLAQAVRNGDVSQAYTMT